MRCCEWCRTTRLERIVWRESDESRMDVEWTKVATMAALSLTMLQQRWRYNSQHCYCCGAAAGAAALLLLCVTTMGLKFLLFFFSTRQLQERKWEREREKGARFETCFPALLIGITPAPSCNNANYLQQHQHTHPPATVLATVAIVATTTITQEFTSKRNMWLSTWSTESGVFL